MKTSKTINCPMVAALMLFVLTVPWTASAGEAGSDKAALATEKVARGKYLVTVAACHDCHTPFAMGPNGPEPDMSRMLSGHPASVRLPPTPELPGGPWNMLIAETNTAWAGPWGISYTANLTPDQDTGLGKWNVKMFVETIRTGRHQGRGRPILPPMPYPMYRNFTDEDLESIFAFLQSIPAISNKVPDPVIADTPAVAELQ